MRIAFSLTTIIGVHSAIVDETELVYGTFIVPEADKQEFKNRLREKRTLPIMEGATAKARVDLSTCFVDQEVKVDKEYKASHILLISNKASAKSASLDSQYFLIRKDIEDQDSALKEKFFDQNIKKLPLPIFKDWEQFFWEGIRPMIKELDSIGNCPYKGYVLKLPSIEGIQELVEISHVKYEYFKKFKRVPKLEALFAIGDIQNFNFKEWAGFLQSIGGPEEFKNLAMNQQKAAVRAFEIFGNDKNVIMNNIPIWHGSALRQVNILIRITKDKNKKATIKNMFKVLFAHYGEKREYIFPLIGNFERLVKEHEQNIRNKNWDAIEKWLTEIRYENVSYGAEELSKVCGKAKVSENEYKLFEAQYLKNLEQGLIAPRTYPTIWSEFAKNAAWEMLDMTVPRAWTVGIETYCCMHPTNVGGVCLEYAAENYETSGILRIEEKGKTIAQSFMWISETDKNGNRVMVLDNIEVAGNNIRELVKEAYLDFADKMEFYARLFKIKAITVGTGYSDIDLSDLCERLLSNKDNLHAKIPSTLRYSDARTQWLLRKYY